MSGRYKLIGHEAVPVDDLIEWARWFEGAERLVSKTDIGDISVSTVFLGLDHNFLREGPPVLYETMIFGGEHDQEQSRYSTWEEAERGHEAAVQLVKGKT